VGLKATSTVHVPIAARVAMHLLLDNTKSPPLTVTASPAAIEAPGLDRVKEVTGLVSPTATAPKSLVGGAKDRAPGGSPVPFSMALTVPPGVAVTVSMPVLAPALLGLKFTATVQVALALIASPQVLAPSTNSVLLTLTWGVPVVAPELVMVKVNGAALVLPTAMPPKS